MQSRGAGLDGLFCEYFWYPPSNPGNSGSPALDAYGRLIGLNFDRVWEGTMSDINYDPSICRNIMVDIRYVLFIIDKFAEAKHLIKEMNLVGGPKI